MSALSRDQILQLQGAARHFQAQWDDALQSWGMRAPAPVVCDSVEAVTDYRRNLAAKQKTLLPLSETRAAPGEPTFAALRRTKYWDLKDDAFDVLEPSLRRAVAVAGKRNDSISFDEPLREIHETDENGARAIRFLGMRSFIHDMKPPVRKVLYFRTAQGPVRTDGKPVQL
jgi:hypothetical protein